MQNGACMHNAAATTTDRLASTPGKKAIKKQEGGLVYKQHTEGGGSNY
jgi:hypothetical protein